MRYVIALIVAMCVLSANNTINAQVHIGVNFNLNSQPAWGPTGNDYAENYYLPDIDVYYNVSRHRFYYNNRGRWRYSTNLPSRYGNYNLYNSYKVVINDRDPWRNHETYREKYASYKGRHDQQPIRDSRDSKYFANKYHPEHNNWVKQQRHNEGNQKSWNRGNDDNRNRRNEGNKQNNNRSKQEKGKNKK